MDQRAAFRPTAGWIVLQYDDFSSDTTREREVVFNGSDTRDRKEQIGEMGREAYLYLARRTNRPPHAACTIR